MYALALAERRGNVFCLPEGYVQEVAAPSDDLLTRRAR